MRHIYCRPFFGVFLLFLPVFVAPEENSVYEYTSENFKQQIEELDGNFVMFYAPWCHHCTKFHPIWNQLADLINREESNFAIAQVDCTVHSKLCNENDVTGYPTLLYYRKNSFSPVEYKGTRDLPSLTLFLSDAFTMKPEDKDKETSEEKDSMVKIYSGMAYLTEHNIEKFVSTGQHFIMFYAPWSRACQSLAPIWAELAVQYSHNEYLQIGKVNCMEHEMTCRTFDVKQYPYLMWIVNGRTVGVSTADNLKDLTEYVEKMMLSENHDPDKFMKKKKALPVVRVTEETFETVMQKDIVYINYFAPWCAHCMQLNPLWKQLGEKFENESRVIIADVDCIQSKAICKMEKVNNLPTLILYKNKEIVSVVHGSQPLHTMVKLVNQHLGREESQPEDAVTTTEAPKDEL